MTYRNYMSEPVTIEGNTIAPFSGRKSLKPSDGVTFILPIKMWEKVRQRQDVITIHKGVLHGVRSVSAD